MSGPFEVRGRAWSADACVSPGSYGASDSPVWEQLKREHHIGTSQVSALRIRLDLLSKATNAAVRTPCLTEASIPVVQVVF